MTAAAAPRRRVTAEVWLVLGVSLGQSAAFAIWTLVERYLKVKPVGEQTTTIVRSASGVPVMDLIYQLMRVGFLLVPVALAAYLLGAGGRRARDLLGLVGPRSQVARDAVRGAVLALAIGLPGLALYVAGRALGQTVRIDTSGLPPEWWTALVLVLSAVGYAVQEEVIAVGYLATRLRELAWKPWTIVLASSVLRGSYHLYQGWPMALGNVVMGAVFTTYFLRRGRLGPLLAAHFLLDAVSLIGPDVVPDSWLSALRLA